MAQEIISIKNIQAATTKPAEYAMYNGITAEQFVEFLNDNEERYDAMSTLVTGISSNNASSYKKLIKAVYSTSAQQITTSMLHAELMLDAIIDSSKAIVNAIANITPAAGPSIPTGATPTADNTSYSINYSGNIDINSITELLKIDTIYNPIKMKLFKSSFKTIAAGISSGIADMLSVLNKETPNLEYVTGFITSLTNIINPTPITTGKSLSLFGDSIFDFSTTSSIYDKKNVKKFQAGFSTMIATIANAISDIQNIEITDNTVKVLENLNNIFGTLGAILNPETLKTNKSFTILGKEIFSRSKEIFDDSVNEKAKQRFDAVILTITDFFTSINSIDVSVDKIETIVLTIGELMTAIKENSITEQDAQNLSSMSSISDFFTSINSIEVSVDKVDTIILTISELLSTIKQNTITEQDGENLKIINTSVSGLLSSFVKYGTQDKLISAGVNSFKNVLNTLYESLTNDKATEAAKSIKSIATGVATLGIAMVAIAVLSPVMLIAAVGLKLFNTVLDAAIDQDTVKQMAFFAMGLASLGIAIWAFGEIVKPESILPVALGIATLAGAMWLFSGKGSKFMGVSTGGEPPVKNMLYVALGLAGMGLAVWTWQALGITYESVLKLSLGMGALAVAAWAYSKVKDTSVVTMIGVAAGVAAFGLALVLWDKLNIKYEDIIQVAVALGTLGGVGILFSKISNSAPLKMIGVALGVAAIGLGMSIFKTYDITIGDMTKIALGVAGMGVVAMIYNAVQPLGILAMIGTGLGIMSIGFGASLFKDISGGQLVNIALFSTAMGLSTYLFGNPMALIGASTMLIVGASLMALGTGVTYIANSGITTDTTWEFMKCMGMITIGYAALAIPAIPATVAAGLLIPVIASTMLTAGALMLISQLTVNSDNITTYISSVSQLVKGYDQFSIGGLGKAVAKSVLLLPIVGATMATATLLKLLTLMTYDSRKIDNYNLSVKTLVNGYDKYGIIELGKTVIKAGLLLPVAAASTALALAIKAVAALKMDPTQIETNAKSMGLFVDVMVDTFDKAGSKAKSAHAGIVAVSGLASTVKSLADAVFMAANLEFTENEVVNGKIVPKSVRKLNADDFQRVGAGIAQLLNSIIDPLITIGSSQETYTIGGVTITNPFGGGNKVKKGIQALSDIGGIFTPLAELISSIANTGVFGKDSENATNKLNNVLGSVIGAIGNMFTDLENLKIKDAKDIIKITDGISPLFEVIASADPTGLKSVNEELAKLVGHLSNKKLFDDFDDHLSSYKSTIAQIKTDINGIELSKAVVLKGIVKDIKDEDSDDNIERLIVKIQELIGAMKDIQTTSNISTSNSNSSNTTNISNTSVNGNNQPAPVNKTVNNDNINISISHLASEISKLVGKLSSTLTVTQRPGDKWQISQ